MKLKTLGLAAVIATVSTAALAKPPALLLDTPKGDAVYQRDLSPELDIMTVSLAGATNMKGALCGDIGGPADGSVTAYLAACTE